MYFVITGTSLYPGSFYRGSTVPPLDCPKYSRINLPSIFSEKTEKIRRELQCCIGQPSPTSSTQLCSVRSICELSSFDNVSIETVSELIALADIPITLFMFWQNVKYF